LPAKLHLTLVELEAGRSTQSTLLGRDEMTIESLYLSPALAAELEVHPTIHRRRRDTQGRYDGRQLAETHR
jgi:DNA adenine methylase